MSGRCVHADGYRGVRHLYRCGRCGGQLARCLRCGSPRESKYRPAPRCRCDSTLPYPLADRHQEEAQP